MATRYSSKTHYFFHLLGTQQGHTDNLYFSSKLYLLSYNFSAQDQIKQHDSNETTRLLNALPEIKCDCPLLFSAEVRHRIAQVCRSICHMVCL